VKISATRADGFIKNPDPAIAIVLLYGPDAGLVRERAVKLVETTVDDPKDPFRVAELAGPELAKDPARLADEASALSMIGGRRAVRVRDAADGLAGAVKTLVATPAPDVSLVILEAGDLPPRSPLRKLCEGEAAAASVPCYLPDAGAIADMARDMVHDAGLRINDEALAYVAENLQGDRQLARRELDKLIAYAGEAEMITGDDARACIGDSTEQSVDDALMAVASGRIDEADRVIEKLWAEGANSVAVLRSAQRHFGRLHQARIDMENGATVDQAIGRLRPPVFFKMQTPVRQQLRLWSQGALARALERLLETEAACKRTGAPAELLTSRALFGLAVQAARTR